MDCLTLSRKGNIVSSLESMGNSQIKGYRQTRKTGQLDLPSIFLGSGGGFEPTTFGSSAGTIRVIKIITRKLAVNVSNISD